VSSWELGIWDDASDYAGVTRKSNACKAVTA
jgi:hypothetical protein